MKTNSLLLLASLAVLATGASAAQNQTNDEVIVLPTYTVAAPRYTAVEKQINSSLESVRQLAGTPVAVPTECAALKALASQADSFAQQARKAPAASVAKL